jgi:BolA protein
MSNPHETLLRERLQALEPSYLEIIDQSHLHAGHAGSAGGASHFEAHITSHLFEGKNKVAQHRVVYDLVKDLMPHPIHALALKLSIPTKGKP